MKLRSEGFLFAMQILLAPSHSFTPIGHRHSRRCFRLEAAADQDEIGRRNWLVGCLSVIGAWSGSPLMPTVAEEQVPTIESIEMQDFVDPVGYFSIRIPKGYFALRRSAKGDLPDPKTGQGRRGSSIFTAGNMQKAELVAVERYVDGESTSDMSFDVRCSLSTSQILSFPTRILLEENGIEATGDLSTFAGLGEPAAIANLLNLRRERDKPGTSSAAIVPGSLSVSSDGKELSFKLRTEIEVQKPELLLEQYGVSELFRVTAAKASLRSNDGNMMAVFASALETDFNGPDGVALEESVKSFQATDQA